MRAGWKKEMEKLGRAAATRLFCFVGGCVTAAAGTKSVLIFRSPRINFVLASCGPNSDKTKIYSERRSSQNSNRTENTQSREVNSLQTKHLTISKRDWNAVFSPLLRDPAASPRSVFSNRQNLESQELEPLVTPTKQSPHTFLIANFGMLFRGARRRADRSFLLSVACPSLVTCHFSLVSDAPPILRGQI